jgi:sodium-dependent dicarboxylate transporter 2/3/5
MMLPIAVAVISQLGNQTLNKSLAETTIGRALMLGIAYGASIGGMATIIGTPTNIILVGVIKKSFGVEIGFSQWMMIGLPISIILLVICWYYLVNIAFDLSLAKQTKGGKEEIDEQLKALGIISEQEKRVLWVFLGVSTAWISRTFVFQRFIPVLDDTIIALTGVMLLFVLPSGEGENKKLLDWKVAEKIPWGILILFGGGLTLASGFQQTGLAQWIGEQFILVQHIPFWLFLFFIIASVNFLTEITSNVATASMLLPILAAVALAMNVHPYGLMVGATFAASCAFMLPVATPPNAIVFGSGFVTLPQMAKAGIWLNIVMITIITIMMYLMIGLVFGVSF